ncbi:hypothetical protein WR25_06896 [Diploscapter pachys]|uniref:BTB domain-containing protein n=1 Tax=Diploscapter pachys TaxID=2018661 RepID=A0A2A2L3Q1_9BILA|nr:hypothetical protein WR25_06896 [Diploscapter pachys]
MSEVAADNFEKNELIDTCESISTESGEEEQNSSKLFEQVEQEQKHEQDDKIDVKENPDEVPVGGVVDLETGTREINLTGGNRVLIHQEFAYESIYPIGKSFDEMMHGSGDHIQFELNFKLHKDGLKEIGKMNSVVQSNPMVIYHDYVLYGYYYSLHVKEHIDKNVYLQFDLHPIGSTLSQSDKSIQKGHAGDNSIPNQKAPQTKNETLEVGHRMYSLKQIGMHYECDELIPLSKIVESVKLTVAKSYFDIFEYYVKPKPNPSIAPANAAALETILSGEKPNGWDLVLTVGEGHPQFFYVHAKIIAHASTALEVMLRTHHSLGDFAMMATGEQRLLTYFYSKCIILPPFDAFARVGRLLSFLFDRNQIDEFFAQWQDIVVNEILNAESTRSYLEVVIEHLIGIYSAPYGAMPVAKRVAVTKLASIIQMHYGTVDELKKDLEKYKDYSKHLDMILGSVDRFYSVVTSITKRLSQ